MFGLVWFAGLKPILDSTPASKTPLSLSRQG